MKKSNYPIKGLLSILTVVFFLTYSLQINAQCANCNANFPAGTFTTTSNSLTTVNTCIYGGEYSNYSVTAGETYTWTTCGDTGFDTQLTLTSGGCGGGFLAYNDDACGLQSTITWTATFTGTVTLLVSQYNCANISSCMTVQWACTTCGIVLPDYLMPTAGINGEFVGSCLVSDCGPSTFTDDGGYSSNYSLNINQIYRVFCPDAAGQCMQVTFNSFNVESGWDFLLVNNGPTQNSPTFTTPPASPTNYGGITGLHGNLATPFSYTATGPSGCLTFRFYSDNTTTRSGWDATLQCVPCTGGPNGTDNSDCQTMTPLCSSLAINANSTGPGIVAEGCTGATCPAGGENHTSWYTFTAQTTGSLDITIVPNVGTGDYDFAVYGPNVTCGALGAPIRCTDSGNTGTTGTTSSAGDFTEDVSGDSFLQTMNVVAGESYILVVDEWSPTSAGGYNLSFGGTASLDCSVLPIELSEFTAEFVPEENVVDLFWITETERDNDHFDVERSTDGINFEVIRQLKGAGTTQNETQYYTIDKEPYIGVNYYRLNQFDINGDSDYSDVRTVNVLADYYDMLSLFPNPTTGKTEVIFNSYTKEEVKLTVIGYDGRIIVNTSLDALPGGNRFDLDMTSQQKGVYIITITTRDKVYTTKLVKN